MAQRLNHFFNNTDNKIMPHVFTYGSLMFETVWNAVVAGKYDCSSALLANYIRKAIISEEYPALISHPGSPGVAGVLYFDITASDILRLDEFEGKIYRRKQELVLLNKDTPLLAEVYVIKDRYRHIVSKKDWDPVHFETTGIKSFVQNYIGFHCSKD